MGELAFFARAGKSRGGAATRCRDLAGAKRKGGAEAPPFTHLFLRYLLFFSRYLHN